MSPVSFQKVALRSVFLAVLFFFSSPLLYGQTAGASTANTSSTQKHEDAVRFVALTGARQRLLDNVDNMAAAGKKAMLEKYPDFNPAYAEEWTKRMRARINVQDYVDVLVKVYEAHFEDEELKELIAFRESAAAGKPVALSTHLKEKSTSQQNVIQSEILGGCTQVGALLGGQIGEEIAKEHPEWVVVSEKSQKPAAQ